MFAWKRTGRNSLGGSWRRSRRAESDRLQYLADRSCTAFFPSRKFDSLVVSRMSRAYSDALRKRGRWSAIRAEWVSIADIKCERGADETAFTPLFLSASVRY